MTTVFASTDLHLDWLRLAVDQSPACVFLTDRSGVIQYVNRRFTAVTGYEPHEAIGRTPRILKSGQTSPEAYAELWRTILAGQVVRTEVCNRRKDGSLYWNEAVITPICDERGEVVQFLAMQVDVTRRKEAEDQLRQSQKMEAIGRLAGGVAHDFNNLLTAIFGYIAFAHDDLGAESPVHGDLREIHKAAERAATLTRQLLAFSRQQMLAPVVLNPNALVEDLTKMLHRLIGEDIELTLRLSEGTGNVRVDPGQLQQVIMNLVVNARDAMPKGGRLLIETANVELSSEYAMRHQPVTSGPYVVLAVSDTGVGMTPAVQARIFEPFFTTKEAGKGTGLGLSTVYGIVKQSGGYIWVYSEPQCGTTFKIYFPRVDDAVAAAPLSESREQLSGTESVLLAEDDANLRILARAALVKLGYTVLEASNATAALELAATRAVHLLITDVVMPGPSGRELARRLAAMQPAAKVLYISGYTDDAMVQHGMLEPGLAFLQKPFTPIALARKVREVLRGP